MYSLEILQYKYYLNFIIFAAYGMRLILHLRIKLYVFRLHFFHPKEFLFLAA